MAEGVELAFIRVTRRGKFHASNSLVYAGTKHHFEVHGDGDTIISFAPMEVYGKGHDIYTLASTVHVYGPGNKLTTVATTDTHGHAHTVFSIARSDAFGQVLHKAFVFVTKPDDKVFANNCVIVGDRGVRHFHVHGSGNIIVTGHDVTVHGADNKIYAGRFVNLNPTNQVWSPQKPLSALVPAVHHVISLIGFGIPLDGPADLSGSADSLPSPASEQTKAHPTLPPPPSSDTGIANTTTTSPLPAAKTSSQSAAPVAPVAAASPATADGNLDGSRWVRQVTSAAASGSSAPPAGSSAPAAGSSAPAAGPSAPAAKSSAPAAKSSAPVSGSSAPAAAPSGPSSTNPIAAAMSASQPRLPSPSTPTPRPRLPSPSTPAPLPQLPYPVPQGVFFSGPTPKKPDQKDIKNMQRMAFLRWSSSTHPVSETPANSSPLPPLPPSSGVSPTSSTHIPMPLTSSASSPTLLTIHKTVEGTSSPSSSGGVDPPSPASSTGSKRSREEGNGGEVEDDDDSPPKKKTRSTSPVKQTAAEYLESTLTIPLLESMPPLCKYKNPKGMTTRERNHCGAPCIGGVGMFFCEDHRCSTCKLRRMMNGEPDCDSCSSIRKEAARRRLEAIRESQEVRDDSETHDPVSIPKTASRETRFSRAKPKA